MHRLVTILIFTMLIMPWSLCAKNKQYVWPEFYKGIYLNYSSSTDKTLLLEFIEQSKAAGINTLVLDVQPAKNSQCPVPKEHLSLLRENGIHAIARIVCFDQGITKLPLKKNKVESLYALAESSAEAGFKEIQFDYIRFADTKYTDYYGKKVVLTADQKQEFLRMFLQNAKTRLNPYEVRIATDVFGRIPWVPSSRNDPIGQKMENFDRVVDVICPMAYPSHYWNDKAHSKNYIALPYETVYITSKKAREKTKNARIVSYIQSFQIKIKPSGLSYYRYIEEQIKACHDANISGFIMWNARQDYKVPFEVVKTYYENQRTYPYFHYLSYLRRGL